jgi:hypothetical protein
VPPAPIVPPPWTLQLTPVCAVSVVVAEKLTGTPNRAVPVFVPSGSVAVICRVAMEICRVALVPPPGDGFCAWTGRLPEEPAAAVTWATTEVADW